MEPPLNCDTVSRIEPCDIPVVGLRERGTLLTRYGNKART